LLLQPEVYLHSLMGSYIYLIYIYTYIYVKLDFFCLYFFQFLQIADGLIRQEDNFTRVKVRKHISHPELF